MKWGWMMIILISSFGGAAQTKKWDGEAGDGQWTNARNWFPDGIPASTDRVILDHHYVQPGYSVLLPVGNLGIEAYQIVIGENASDTIKLVIPESNTISPAITTNDPLISILIKDRGMLINRSGANAGNTFQMTGNMRIENGGMYVHQTIRGTAAILSKLQMDNSTATGIFAVDVPGTAGYILSLSGRSYGTLTLSAEHSGGKRSYAGSGNNTLNIQGDLNILKGTSLITTLNGTIQIQGSLYNEGAIQFNPTNTDTTARSIVFKGKASSVINRGIITCNAHLRKICIDSNASLQLKSNLEIIQSALVLELNGRLICDTFHVSGMGVCRSTPGAWIETSTNTILSSDSTQGCMRTNIFEIHKSTGFSITGEEIQHTGNAFPDSISALVMNKHTGMLVLDKPIYVKDSFALIRGILKSDQEHLLSYSGTKVYAKKPYSNQNTEYEGYVSGAMKYNTATTDSLYFPLGDDTSFAPCSIRGLSNNSYQISYDAEDHLHKLPLKYNQKSFSHWHIQHMPTVDSIIKQERISLYLGNITLNKRELPVMIFNNYTDSLWEGKPQVALANQNIFLQSQPIFIQDGVYSIASQFYDALPLERIQLFLIEHNGVKELQWVTTMDEKPTKCIVEKSVDGYAFKSLGIKTDHIIQNNNDYKLTLPVLEAAGYFRITAEVGERKISSNIIHINKTQVLKPFPNPAFDEMYIQMKESVDNKQFELIDMMGRKYPLKMKWNGATACIAVSHLPHGNYMLIQHDALRIKTWSFLKN